VGVLVTDPVDRPGRGALLLDGLRLGLDAARDLDAVITARGSAPFGPALLDAAAGLLEGGADVLVVTSTGVAGLVGPTLRHARDRPGGGRRGRPGRAPRRAPAGGAASYRAHLAGGLRDGPVVRAPPRGRPVPAGHARGGGRSTPLLALRAGFTETGATSPARSRCGPSSASAGALVARVSGAPGHRGARHGSPAARDRRRPATRLASRPTSSWSVAVWTSGRWSTWGGAARCTPPRPGTARTCPTSSSPSSAARERGPTRSPPSATTWPACSSTPPATNGDCAPPDQDGGLVVRRAASGRSTVVARRATPVDAPDLTAAGADPSAAPALARLTGHGARSPSRAAARPSLSAMTSSTVRRLLAGAAVGGLLLTGLGVLGAERHGAGSPSVRGRRATRLVEVAAEAEVPVARWRASAVRRVPKLPGGGTRVFGKHRFLVAYYGTAGTGALGCARRDRARRDAPPAAAGGPPLRCSRASGSRRCTS
jgi:hypothetical protein